MPPSLTVPTALPITPTHHSVTGSSATLRSADALQARGERGDVGDVDPNFVSVAAGREGYGEITTARYVSPDERWPPTDSTPSRYRPGTGAVFHTTGPHPSAPQQTWAATEWFPSNPWRLRPGPETVAVLERTDDFSTATCELWLPARGTDLTGSTGL